MCGCKPWPMKNKHCVRKETWACGLSGSFKTIQGLEF